MITSYMKYGALSAKVRAMYGKRLRADDFEHMATLGGPQDVMESLRAQPGWTAAVADLSADRCYVGRVELEAALRRQLSHDYGALIHFVPRVDKDIVSFPVRLAELSEIMNALRRLKSGTGDAGGPSAPEYASAMKIDRAAMRTCISYASLVNAAKGSIYHIPLASLRPDQSGGPPDYAVVEAILQAAYYSYLYKVVHQNYAGETQRVLLRAFGEQVDLLNLIHLLRIKTYFPGEAAFHATLFPFSYKLTEDKLKALSAAAGREEFFALLEGTPYAKALDGLPQTAAGLEAYYRSALYRFNKRQLTSGEPSVYTAVAYLNLKELELQALIRLIECVKYGVDYDDAFARLISG